MIKQKDGFQGEQQIVLPPMVIEMERKDPLVSSLYVTDIGYYPNATHHYRERQQAIDQYVLIYCVEGSGFYILKGKNYKVEKNQFFILPAGVPHVYGTGEGKAWTIYWVHFCGEHAAIYAEGMQTPQNINVAMNSRIKDRIAIFEDIFTTLHLGRDIEDLRYASSLLHHFLASMRFLGQFRKAQPENMNVVDAAIHYMEENYEKKFNIKELLDYVGYSQSHFSALFRKQTGRSPLSYFNRLKIKYACRLLTETDLKINQICYKIGIEDQFYFSRLFSKVMNMSPTAYRAAGHSE